MLDKGAEKALKSGEVQRQTADILKKNSAADAAAVQQNLFGGSLQNAASPDQTNFSGAVLAPAQTQAGNDSQRLPEAEVIENRGPGRPKGSRNKSTQEWVDYFMTKNKSPLMVLGELYSKDTIELAREMRCDRIDALKLQISAANAVLPYVHKKQPLAIETTGEELPTINIYTSPTMYQQINNGVGQVKREIIVDGIASTTPEEISLKNNDLTLLEVGKSEKEV